MRIKNAPPTNSQRQGHPVINTRSNGTGTVPKSYTSSQPKPSGGVPKPSGANFSGGQQKPTGIQNKAPVRHHDLKKEEQKKPSGMIGAKVPTAKNTVKMPVKGSIGLKP